MCYTIDEIQHAVVAAAERYNAEAETDAKITGIALFGSYAYGAATDDSDVDLLVSFSSPVVSLFILARALEALEQALSVPVDLVQEPLPDGCLLEIDRRVPLYEAA